MFLRKQPLALLAVLGSICVACAAEPTPDDYTPNEPSRSSSKKTKSAKLDDSDDDTTDDTAPVAPVATTSIAKPVAPAPPPVQPVAAPTDTTWTGTLTKTSATTFGGGDGGYCTYRTHFENVSVKVVIDSTGTVKSAAVLGTAVEEVLNGCTLKPIAPNLHDYVLDTTTTGTVFDVQGGGTTAQPQAKMTANLATGATTSTINLTWHRNDIGAPFDWTISAKVTLTKQ